MATVAGHCKSACAARVSTEASDEYRLMAVVIGFHCVLVNCELARRGVQRGEAVATAESRRARAW